MKSAAVIDFLIQDPPQDPSAASTPWANTKAPAIDGYGQLSELASTFDHVDGLFYFTYAVCIVFFVLIAAVLGYSVVAHRRKTWDQKALSNVTHNTPLEVVWTVIPLIIVMVMFAWGFKGSLDMTNVPHEASRNLYKATAKQWSWSFTYPDGTQSFDEVWVQVDKPVAFALESTDVLHAFYVPSMRVKRDVVPGRLQTAWFHPTKQGDYHLFCAEYCGKDHSRMYATVHVVDEATMDKQPWNQVPGADAPIADRVEYGKQLAKQCISCHNIGDGNPAPANIGPSWLGMFTKDAEGNYVGRQRQVIEGGETKTITVDDAYVAESIVNPNAKIVAEEPYNKGGMSSFANLDEARISCLIDYMKSLADN